MRQSMKDFLTFCPFFNSLVHHGGKKNQARLLIANKWEAQWIRSASEVPTTIWRPTTRLMEASKRIVFLKEKFSKMGNLKKLPTAKNGDNFKVYLSFFNFFQKYQHIIFNTCPPLTPLSLFFAGG